MVDTNAPAKGRLGGGHRTLTALSPSACLRRVQELERSGVIKGYRAVVDREKLGEGFTAYVAVGLSDHSKKPQEGFEHAMEAAPQVRECHYVALDKSTPFFACSPPPHRMAACGAGR